MQQIGSLMDLSVTTISSSGFIKNDLVDGVKVYLILIS
jgi:hypothetical protein